MVSFSYYSHIFRDSYGSGMGIAWETYHKGVPLLGVPENTLEPPPQIPTHTYEKLEVFSFSGLK